ncbi:MAG TPA: ATP-binding protein [Actinomycetota bacterium]|nr:ATP-binding protein [Actinomycetota bacterium]
MATGVLSLEINPDPQMIAMARMFVASVARHHAVDEDSVDDIKIVISEACTNSVKAHQSDGIEDPIRIIAYLEDELLYFEVLDEGAGLDLSVDSPDAEHVTPSAGLYEGSLGLQLIRSLFPKSEIGSRDERGTFVRIPVPFGTATD